MFGNVKCFTAANSILLETHSEVNNPAVKAAAHTQMSHLIPQATISSHTKFPSKHQLRILTRAVQLKKQQLGFLFLLFFFNNSSALKSLFMYIGCLGRVK